jgi:predicted aspartyl protease
MPQTTKCGFDDTPTTSGRDLLVTYGPTLLVDIGFDPSYVAGPNEVVPTAGITGVNALVDTGARESHIDAQLAAQLNLPIVDRRAYGAASGLHQANIYLAQIRVPALFQTIYGEFAGVDLAGSGQLHRALIGRTFLRLFTMVYDGVTGSVTISKR